MAVVYCAMIMTVTFAFATLAIDYGRMQIAKTELRQAADAGARYACVGLADGTFAAKAISAAQDNYVAGSTMTITASDVVKGYYDSSTKAFTAAGSPTNAVQVTCARTGANGIPLLLAKVFGMSKFDVKAFAIASASPQIPPFTGLSSIDVKNNTFIGSYNSGATINPSHSNHNGSANMGSNGAVDAGNGSTLSGKLYLGPSGSNSGMTLIDGGTQISNATAFVAPSDPAWTPGSNPNGVAQNYTVNSATLAGGTYWFTSLAINGTLTFSGPTTIYVNGDVDLGGDLIAYQSIPSNLKIYQIGSHTFGSSGANGMNVTAVVIAPNSDFEAKNNLTFSGSGLFKSITAKNNADFYYDQAITAGTTGPVSIVMVK